jgi:hypothetical protein
MEEIRVAREKIGEQSRILNVAHEGRLEADTADVEAERRHDLMSW